MEKSSTKGAPSIIRSTAVISLGLVALAGTVASTLFWRVVAVSTGSNTPPTKVSKLVLDEWEADLARLNLPTRGEVAALQQQLVELEAEIDQLIQHSSESKEGD